MVGLGRLLASWQRQLPLLEPRQDDVSLFLGVGGGRGPAGVLGFGGGLDGGRGCQLLCRLEGGGIRNDPPSLCHEHLVRRKCLKDWPSILYF